MERYRIILFPKIELYPTMNKLYLDMSPDTTIDYIIDRVHL